MKQEWIRVLERNTGVLKFLLKDLKPADLSKPLGQSNTIDWIVGHLAVSRGSLLKAMGEQLEMFPWEAEFSRGAEKKASAVDLAEVLPVFLDRGGQLKEQIPLLTESRLCEKSDRTLPDGGDDLQGYVSFLLWHETFHLGQIDLIQAGLGIGGIP